MARVILFIALFAAASAAMLAVREARYGAGPRYSAADIDGPAREIVFVSNAVEGVVTLIDIAELAVVGEINVLPDGARVGPFRDFAQWIAQPIAEGRGGLNYAQDADISRDGRVLFVSRGFLGDVAAFDIASGDLLWRTPIAGVRADHMAISPDGTRLYVSAVVRGGNVVEALDAETGERIGSFRAGDWPHDVHASADGRRVYVASLGDMTLPLEERGASPTAYRIVVADAETFDVLRTYDFPAGVRPFALARAETRLYAQFSQAHEVRLFDLETFQELKRLSLPVAAGVSEDDWDFEAPHHGLALSPDAATLCIAGRASDYAAFVRADDLSLIATVPVGDAPSWAVYAAGGEVCVLPNTRSDDVSVVSVTDLREVARIPVGRGPKHATVGDVPVSVLDARSAR